MPEQTVESLLLRQAQELKTIRELLGQVIVHIVDAESEIPEKMRRFIMYMHDIHDVSYMYEERGHAVPEHILREMERCDDRFRQLLKESHAEGGTFNKVRRAMAEDPLNRWDHTRLLDKPKEGSKDETRTSEQQRNGVNEG